MNTVCNCGSGFPVDTDKKCLKCRYTQWPYNPTASLAENPISYATIRVEKLDNGYLLQYNYKLTEVYTSLTDLFQRLKDLLS